MKKKSPDGSQSDDMTTITGASSRNVTDLSSTRALKNSYGQRHDRRGKLGRITYIISKIIIERRMEYGRKRFVTTVRVSSTPCGRGVYDDYGVRTTARGQSTRRRRYYYD